MLTRLACLSALVFALGAAELPEPSELGARVLVAHNVDDWFVKRLVDCQVAVSFGGRQVIDHRFRFAIGGPEARMDGTGVSVIHDGERCWITPHDAELERGRFHVLTWPWFVRAPFVLGQTWQQLGPVTMGELQGEPMLMTRQTFPDGTGDTPDDWYLLYVDPESHRLRAMAYIVTYGKSAEEAEQKPHLIRYDEYGEVDGALIPITWSFWNWSEAEGIVGEEPIGFGAVGDINLYPRSDPKIFARGDYARDLPLP